MPKLMVRYGELGLKSPSVRRRFENALLDDIRRRHFLAGVPCVISAPRGRVFVDSDDWRRSCEILSRTFGVVSFSPVIEASSELDELTRAVVEFSADLMYAGASFAMRTRRTGNHPYTSHTLAEHLGRELLKRFADKHISVRLDEPDVEISVEVRDKKAYLFSSVLAGPGGMPLGTQGKVLSVVTSERGIASSWLMMKRGCTTLLAASDASATKPLEAWYPQPRHVDLTDDLFALAHDHGCTAVALELSLADIQRGRAVKGDLPVFYPLIGMAESEVAALLSKIRA